MKNNKLVLQQTTSRNTVGSAILLCLFLSMSSWAQTTYAPDSGKEKITIKGKIIDKDTNKPPIGLVRLIEKGAVLYWVFPDKENPGAENYAFAEADGTYTFTIDKGSEIKISDYTSRYNPYFSSPLTHSQTLDVALTFRPDQKEKRSQLRPQEVALLKKLDRHKKVWVEGTLTDANGQPAALVTIKNNFLELSTGGGFHAVSDPEGKFKIQIPKGGRIGFYSSRFESVQFTIQSDTVINMKMLRHNPFKKRPGH